MAMKTKLIIYDYKIDSESCFFMSIKSQLALNRFIGLIKEIPFKEVILCTEEIGRARQLIEAELGQRPDIQIVRSVSSPSTALVLKANCVYDKKKLLKLIKKGIPVLSSAVLWEIRDKKDIKNAEATLDRIENYPLAKYINLPLARIITGSLLKTRVKPNHLTFVSLIAGILAAFCFIFKDYTFLILGTLLIQLHCTLDFADGHLARLKNMSSGVGAFLDGIVNQVVESFCYAGISYGLFVKYNDKFFFIVGILVILGHFMIGYVNFLKKKYLKSTFNSTYQIGNKKWLFRMLKEIYRFFEQWDVRLYIISFFAILNRLEVAIIYFAIDFNARWIFNVVKIISK